jgi:Na+/proline symporter
LPILTDAEFTEIRYSGNAVLPLRVLKAVYYGTVINCIVMAMVLVAAMRIAEVFLPWDQWLPTLLYNPFLSITNALGLSLGSGIGAIDPAIVTTNNIISILVILGFTALYSTTGGLRSVVATDVMQFGIAMIGTMIYAYYVVDYAGGWGQLLEKIQALYGEELAGKMLSFSPSGGELLLPFLIIIGLQWFFQMNSDGTGYLAQRSMACATDKDARIAAVLFSWVQIFLRSIIWLIIGVGLMVVYPFAQTAMSGETFAASREITFIIGINDLLPPGIRGLMLTGLLAALASTLDTHLNWGASYWSNDVYKRLICEHWLKRKPKNHELVITARLSNILIIVIALIIMANLGSIQTAWFVSLLFGAGMGSVLVLRWLWERINLYSELAAMASSLIVAPILLVVTDVEWIRLGSMALISTLSAVLVTFFTPRTKQNILNDFYKRVKPMGLWQNTAKATGGDSKLPLKQLFLGFKSVAITSISLFAMLIGVGKLVLFLPGDSIILPCVFILISLALVPLWWKDMLQSADEKL